MRIWAYQLLPYLPDAQLKGQLRELVAIIHGIKQNGTPNHILVNQVVDFSQRNLSTYFWLYRMEYRKRFGKDISSEIVSEFVAWGGGLPAVWPPFDGWHCNEYLRVCMANLYEKHYFGHGKSRITDEEWESLETGYEEITGEKYKI